MRFVELPIRVRTKLTYTIRDSLQVMHTFTIAAPLHMATMTLATVRRPAFIVPGGVVLPTSVSVDALGRDEYDSLGPVVCPILYGGLGNVLFQLAAIQVYCKETGAICVSGGWGGVQHWNRGVPGFEEWGGHLAPGPGITLRHVFPNLRWLGFQLEISPQNRAGTVKNQSDFPFISVGDFLCSTMPPFRMHVHHDFGFSFRLLTGMHLG